MEIRWEPPLPHDRNGVVTGYSVDVQEQQTGDHVASLLVVNDTSVNVTALKPYTTYTFTVSARNSIGYGPYLNVYHTTLEDSKLITSSLSTKCRFFIARYNFLIPYKPIQLLFK